MYINRMFDIEPTPARRNALIYRLKALVWTLLKPKPKLQASKTQLMFLRKFLFAR